MSLKFAAFTVMLPDLKPEEAVTALAKAGYDGVEWRVTTVAPERRTERPSYWGNNLCTLEPTTEHALLAKRLAHESNLKICNLGTYLGPGDLAHVEAAMQFANQAGVACLRINTAAYQGDYFAAFNTSLEFFQEVEILAKKYHLKALVETHQGLITSSASLTHRFVSHFDPAYIGVIYDPGNMVLEGYEQHKMGLELLGPYLAHVHLKNAAYKKSEGRWQAYWAPIDDGIVDMKAFLRILLGLGYDGWLVMEDFSGSRPAIESLHYNLNYIKSILAELNDEA